MEEDAHSLGHIGRGQFPEISNNIAARELGRVVLWGEHRRVWRWLESREADEGAGRGQLYRPRQFHGPVTNCPLAGFNRLLNDDERSKLCAPLRAPNFLRFAFFVLRDPSLSLSFSATRPFNVDGMLLLSMFEDRSLQLNIYIYIVSLSVLSVFKMLALTSTLASFSLFLSAFLRIIITNN